MSLDKKVASDKELEEPIRSQEHLKALQLREYWIQEAKGYFEQRDYPRALNAYVLSNCRFHTIEKARELKKAREFSWAFKFYDAALGMKDEGALFDAAIGLSETASYTGLYKEAYNKIKLIEPHEGASEFCPFYNNLGDLLFNLGDYEGAAKCFQKVDKFLDKHKIYGDDPTINYNLYETYMALGYLSLAQIVLETLAKSLGDGISTLHLYVYLAKNDYKNAGKIIKSYPKEKELLDVDYLIAKGQFETRLNNYQAAENILLPLHQRFVCNLRVLVSLGDLYTKKRDFTEALKYYSDALKISPDYIDALNGKAAVCLSQGNLEAARDTIQKAKAICPLNSKTKELSKLLLSGRDLFVDSVLDEGSLLDCKPIVIDKSSSLPNSSTLFQVPPENKKLAFASNNKNKNKRKLTETSDKTQPEKKQTASLGKR